MMFRFFALCLTTTAMLYLALAMYSIPITPPPKKRRVGDSNAPPMWPVWQAGSSSSSSSTAPSQEVSAPSHEVSAPSHENSQDAPILPNRTPPTAAAPSALGEEDDDWGEEWSGGFEIDDDYIQCYVEDIEHDGYYIQKTRFVPKPEFTTAAGARKIRPGYTLERRFERNKLPPIAEEESFSEDASSTNEMPQGTVSATTISAPGHEDTTISDTTISAPGQEDELPVSRIAQGKQPFGSNHPDDWYAWRNQIHPDDWVEGQ